MRSIYVEPVRNRSLCPKASGMLTAQLTKKIQRSAALKLMPKDEAQTCLQIEIIEFSQKGSTFDSKDTSTILSFDLRVKAECTLMDKEGRYLWERRLVEEALDLGKERNFHTLRDQAIAQLMERLARKIGALLINIW
ncbi:MAG: LPS assembly lipoprotein LptE [Puniceicoccales bacterium]|jgi:hypothetical protein|nr:LPS assembly lipoprotein LptE [Puniceicoccales bacterium]